MTAPIQIGPGMFTVNSTADYTWDDFRPRVLSAVNALYEAHPKVAELQISNLTLRYIDAIDFDYMEHNAFTFIQENLKAQFSLSEELFSGTNVSNKPCGFTWQTSFQCERPLGRITLRFAAGQKQNIPSIIWETIVESAGDDIPKMPAEFEEWIDLAHDLTHNWFFKMIDGELLRRFKGV